MTRWIIPALCGSLFLGIVWSQGPSTLAGDELSITGGSGKHECCEMQACPNGCTPGTHHTQKTLRHSTCKLHTSSYPCGTSASCINYHPKLENGNDC